MPFINTTPAREAEDTVLDMYERQQSAWGYVPNYAKVFCYRPEVMARWGRLLAEIRRPMSARRFELLTFAAAIALRTSRTRKFAPWPRDNSARRSLIPSRR
jgi:hypothetical protein